MVISPMERAPSFFEVLPLQYRSHTLDGWSQSAMHAAYGEPEKQTRVR